MPLFKLNELTADVPVFFGDMQTIQDQAKAKDSPVATTASSASSSPSKPEFFKLFSSELLGILRSKDLEQLAVDLAEKFGKRLVDSHQLQGGPLPENAAQSQGSKHVPTAA